MKVDINLSKEVKEPYVVIHTAEMTPEISELANTISELLMSAEYIMAGGNEKVILCERGIRTFETYTRNTTDICAIPVLKKLTHLPVLIDPSHATGRYSLVPSISMASVTAGCDGLLIEVHNDPQHALSDGAQSLRPDKFDILAKNLLDLHKYYKSLPEMNYE